MEPERCNLCEQDIEDSSWVLSETTGEIFCSSCWEAVANDFYGMERLEDED